MLARASMGRQGAMGRRTHYSQTTTIGIMKTTLGVPTNIFLVGDTITVVGNSKEYCGRSATVQKVGSQRLTVHFHDKNKRDICRF